MPESMYIFPFFRGFLSAADFVAYDRIENLRSAAEILGVRLQVLNASSEQEFEQVFSATAEESAGGLVFTSEVKSVRRSHSPAVPRRRPRASSTAHGADDDRGRGDGRDEIITGTGVGGGPFVKVFSGVDGHFIKGFFAYGSNFRGGVTVAAVIGMFLPNLLRLLRRNPQVAAGPIALAFADLITLLLYFRMAQWLLA